MNRIYYIKRTRKSKKNVLKVFLFFLILIVIPTLIFSGHLSPLNSEKKPVLTPPYSSPSPTNIPVESKTLEQAVQAALTGSTGNYGIVVKNLKTGEYYSLRENTEYNTASLYKLWIMATAYEQMRDGKLKDEDILSQDVEVLNKKFNIASESAELKEGTISLSVHEALDKMITISDNYAALLLTEKIRLSSVATFLKKNGFMQSKVGVNGEIPTTTPYDIAIFFEKLYNNQLINAQYSNKMLSLLKKQKLNTKIPKYLSGSITISHKTGELDEYTHDAGIIYTNKGDYIIVLLSKSKNPSLAANRLANISESVYRYFEKQ